MNHFLLKYIGNNLLSFLLKPLQISLKKGFFLYQFYDAENVDY